MTHSEIAGFLWGVADLLRDSFKRGKYQDVILPLTVLRRLDCVLKPTRQEVRETHAKYKAKLDNLGPQLRRAIELLRERRTALISAAVTGKIDVRTASSSG